MANVAALTGVASSLAQTAAPIATSAGFTGAASILGAAIPVLGLAAVAAPFVSNLFSCGTLGTIGCVKTGDTNATEAIARQAAQIGYQVEQGQITAAEGTAQLQQIIASAPSQFQRPTDWTQSSGNPWNFTGNKGWDGLPTTSKAGMVDTGALVSPQQYVEDMIAFVQSVAPPSGSAAAQAISNANPISAVSAATNAASAATGLPGWVLLAGAAVGLYFLVK